MFVKNIPVRSLKNLSVLWTIVDLPLRGVPTCFSRGGGVSYRIAGEKPHLKKSKPAGFSRGDTFGRTLFPGEKCQRDVQLKICFELTLFSMIGGFIFIRYKNESD